MVCEDARLQLLVNGRHSWPLFGILVPAPEHDLVAGEGRGRKVVVYAELTSILHVENE